jgi:hypothetical protein
MKYLIIAMTKVALITGVAFGFAFLGLNSVDAQNMTVPSNMTGSANMTGGNMTTSDTSVSSAKMHLEEAIKALQSGDKQGATTHLGLAEPGMVNAPPAAIMHFGEGMKALSAGNTNGAITHLTAADQSLG